MARVRGIAKAVLKGLGFLVAAFLAGVAGAAIAAAEFAGRRSVDPYEDETESAVPAKY